VKQEALSKSMNFKSLGSERVTRVSSKPNSERKSLSRFSHPRLSGEGSAKQTIIFDQTLERSPDTLLYGRNIPNLRKSQVQEITHSNKLSISDRLNREVTVTNKA
jgi:hypothetical protein